MNRSFRLVSAQNILRKKFFKKIGVLAILPGFALAIQSCENPSEKYDPYAWEFVNPTNVPANAIHTGYERSRYPENAPELENGQDLMDDRPLYICRVTGYSDRIGKVAPSGKCHIPTRYEVNFSTGEILDERATITVDAFSQFEVLVPETEQELDWKSRANYPRQENGEYPDSLVRVDDSENSPLICSVYHEQMREDGVLRFGMHPGFVDERIDKCVFSWDEGIGSLSNYSVLTVNDQP